MGYLWMGWSKITETAPNRSAAQRETSRARSTARYLAIAAAERAAPPRSSAIPFVIGILALVALAGCGGGERSTSDAPLIGLVFDVGGDGRAVRLRFDGFTVLPRVVAPARLPAQVAGLDHAGEIVVGDLAIGSCRQDAEA